MPTSPERHPRQQRKAKKHVDPLALDRMLDMTVTNSFAVPAPPVLYHYTKWVGAEGILLSQRFRATAHDCTNAAAELVSANDIIMEVAEDLRKQARGPDAPLSSDRRQARVLTRRFVMDRVLLVASSFVPSV